MTTPNGWKTQFFSDTVAGICPQAFEALQCANEAGFVPSYGEDDAFSGQARERIYQLFGKSAADCRAFFVSSGTVANALSLASMCQSFDGVLCHPLSHLEHDEANAPEYLTGGAKLLHVEGSDGKIDPASMLDILHRGHAHHSARPRVISITQATEIGTVYSLAQLAELQNIKTEIQRKLQERYENRDFQMFFHMDGARFANAVVSLQCEPRELIKGVDILSFGGSKNGGPPTETILFFHPGLAHDFAWRVKQAGQLVSKMRYVSAPWLGLLKEDTWLTNATHANKQARTLAQGFQHLGIPLVAAVEANMVFTRLQPQHADALRGLGWHFPTFQLPGGISHRFSCHWNTSDEAIEDLLQDLQQILASPH